MDKGLKPLVHNVGVSFLGRIPPYPTISKSSYLNSGAFSINVFTSFTIAW